MVDAAGSFWLDLGPDRPAFGRPVFSHGHNLLSYVSYAGLEVSPGGFFENGIVQRKISYQFLEAGIFYF